MEKNVLPWSYVLVTIAKLSIPSFFDANCNHDGREISLVFQDTFLEVKPLVRLCYLRKLDLKGGQFRMETRSAVERSRSRMDVASIFPSIS
jgi:hypothetical protein